MGRSEHERIVMSYMLRIMILSVLILPTMLISQGCQFLAGAATGAAATEAAEEVDDDDGD
jgi:hypothetical protein